MRSFIGQKNLPALEANIASGKGAIYLDQFLAYHTHRLKDAQAVVRNACKELRDTDADLVKVAAIHAYTIFVENAARETGCRWDAEITGQTPASGTQQNTSMVRQAFENQGKHLKQRLVAMNDWAVEELKQGLDDVLSKMRFDAYQQIAAAATKEMAIYSKASAYATIAIAFFTLVTAAASLWLGWMT